MLGTSPPWVPPAANEMATTPAPRIPPAQDCEPVVTPESSSSAIGRDIGELRPRSIRSVAVRLPHRYTLMEIAADRRIVQHVAPMPPSWGTLYHLTKLDDAQFTKLLKSRVIRPDLERHEIICCAMPSRSHRPTDRPRSNVVVVVGCTSNVPIDHVCGSVRWWLHPHRSSPLASRVQPTHEELTS